MSCTCNDEEVLGNEEFDGLIFQYYTIIIVFIEYNLKRITIYE